MFTKVSNAIESMRVHGHTIQLLSALCQEMIYDKTVLVNNSNLMVYQI